MRHFKLSEFNCPCCGGNRMHLEFLERLDKTRELAGFPFIINSGCRCPAHNIEIKGSPTSSHMRGWAADVQAETDHQKYKLIFAAQEAGFNRFGVYTAFIHLDCDPGKTGEVIFRGDK